MMALAGGTACPKADKQWHFLVVESLSVVLKSTAAPTEFFAQRGIFGIPPGLSGGILVE